MFRSTAPRASQRAAYIDWTRGLAVLLMIEAHTVDAWTRSSSRGSSAHGYALMAAGFAAPLFLWLAGLAVPLASASAVRRGASRRAAAERMCRRGLEIFILAFLFRLQAFVLSPGAHPVTLFRVDILNVMGPAIVVCALVWLSFESATALAGAYSLLAIATTVATPLVWKAGWVTLLPTWVQWYLRPAGDNTTFTGFPWMGFAFAGAAVGVAIAAAGERGALRKALSAIGVLGVAIIGLGFAGSSLPSIYAGSSFWTTSPAYFAIRTGVVMVALSIAYATGEVVPNAGRAASALARFGRSSLFVYWIHVELVYGYASWPIHRRLPLWGTAIGFAVLTALLYWAILLRDRVVAAWRGRRSQMSFQYKAEAV